MLLRVSDLARLGAGGLAGTPPNGADRAVCRRVRLRPAGGAALCQCAAGCRVAAAHGAAAAGSRVVMLAPPLRYAGCKGCRQGCAAYFGQQHRAFLGAAVSFVCGALRRGQPLPHPSRGGASGSGYAVECRQRGGAERPFPGGGYPVFRGAAVLPLPYGTAGCRAGSGKRCAAVRYLCVFVGTAVSGG